MLIIHIDSGLELAEHAEEGRKEVGDLNIEEAVPLNSAELMETVINMTVPLWVR